MNQFGPNTAAVDAFVETLADVRPVHIGAFRIVRADQLAAAPSHGPGSNSAEAMRRAVLETVDRTGRAAESHLAVEAARLALSASNVTAEDVSQDLLTIAAALVVRDRLPPGVFAFLYTPWCRAVLFRVDCVA